MAFLASIALLATLTTVFSPAALGDPPDEECSSLDPAWNGEYWKVEEDDGVLDDVETNVSGATTLTAAGSWTNNNDNPAFRIVLKLDDDDDDSGSGDTQVLTGFWETGEGGTIDLTLDGLEHVTFCFTNAGDDEEESTTTTLGSTTTTSAPGTTTTSGADPVTTPGVSTPTTSPGQGATGAPEDSTTSSSEEPTSTAAAGTTGGSLPNTSEPGEETDPGDSGGQTVGSSSDADTDKSMWPPIGKSGTPPVAGQAPVSAQAEPDPNGGSRPWPTLGDLATLGSLVAAIAVVMGRRRIGRLVKSLRWQD